MTTALTLALLLDLGVATCARYAGLGRGGYFSFFDFYLHDFEAVHFPDPAGLRSTLRSATLGLYPGALKAAMALFDVPEAVAVGRAAACAAGARGASSLPRPQATAYYGGMLAYYWLLATPAVGLVFGSYLYVACNWCGVHHDEAFSALRVPGFKGFTRLRFAPSGDLHVYTVATDAVPSAWCEDPRWRGPGGGGGGTHRPAHEAAHPSRWAPAASVRGRRAGRAGAEPVFRVVDLLVVPKDARKPSKGGVVAGGAKGDAAPPPAAAVAAAAATASPAKPATAEAAPSQAAAACTAGGV